MTILLITVSGVYFISMLVVIWAWRHIPSYKTEVRKYDKVSLIIPMRDEINNMTNILYDIRQQDYPKDKLEVIVVDDHSSDGSVDLVRHLTKQYNDQTHVLSLDNHQKGKKNALTKGVNHATGRIIVTTDADCRFSPLWISTIVMHFDDTTELVFGPVRLMANTWFERLQMTDFAALIGMGAATWRLGFPGMCNGANLAFTKEAFEKCGGYSGTAQYPSGDDEFLLRKIYQYYPEGIRFAKDHSAIVSTRSANTARSFFQQRIRWAGKWKLHNDIMTKSIATFIFFFYLILLGMTLWSIIYRENTYILIGIWWLKWLLDVILVKHVLHFVRVKTPWLETVLLSLVYPFYAIGIGLSTISYNFEWKGRQY